MFDVVFVAAFYGWLLASKPQDRYKTDRQTKKQFGSGVNHLVLNWIVQFCTKQRKRFCHNPQVYNETRFKIRHPAYQNQNLQVLLADYHQGYHHVRGWGQADAAAGRGHHNGVQWLAFCLPHHGA